MKRQFSISHEGRDAVFCAGSADEKIEALPSYLQKYLAKKTRGKAMCFRCLAGMGDDNFMLLVSQF